MIVPAQFKLRRLARRSHIPLGLFLLCIFLSASREGFAQLAGDQLGSHDLTPTGTGPVKGALTNSCLYCHAPHGAMSSPTPLWNQQLSIQTYNFYTSTTYHQTGVQPGLNSPSKLCLSCHDGTVAPGQTVIYGKMSTTGSMKTTSVFGSDLKSSHPFSLVTPLVDTPNVNTLLFGTPPKTADPTVSLINGTIECTTCHEPHATDNPRLLSAPTKQQCIACHNPHSPKMISIAGTPVSLVEVIGFVTGAWCVWLVGRQNPWNWPVGLIQVVAYLFLFWESGLYGDSLNYTFTGKVAGDEMAGDVSLGEYLDARFTAKRHASGRA